MKLKKLCSIFLTLGAFFLLTSSVQALNIGGSIKSGLNKTATGAARGAVQNEYNKKLAKQKCKFVGTSTTEYKGCNIDKIIGEMNALRNAAEGSGFANDVNVLVQAHGQEWDIARQRAEFIRNKVRAQVGYWDYSVKYTKAPSNDVYFQVQIR